MADHYGDRDAEFLGTSDTVNQGVAIWSPERGRARTASAARDCCETRVSGARMSRRARLPTDQDGVIGLSAREGGKVPTSRP